jgi:GTP cyclohydrolase II
VYEEDSRSYESAFDMLDDLGVDEVNLLTNNPLKLEVLTRCGLKDVKRISIEVGSLTVNQDYLETKFDRTGYLFSTLGLPS